MARQGYRVPLFLALMCLASVCYAAPDKVTLAYKAKAGQVARYKSEGTMSFEAGGNKMTGEIKETEKVTVAEVAASGNITLERETESSEVTFNGQRAPSMDSDKTKITMTIRPDGSLVAYKSSSGKEEQDKSQAHLFAATTPLLPDKPVGVGDKWSRDLKSDSDLGIKAAHADYEVLGFETLSGVETVKIKVTYQDSEAPKMGVTGTWWLEKTSGDEVAADYEIENFTFGEESGGPSASFKVHEERISGGLLDGKGVEAKPGAKSESKTETKPEPKKEKTIDDIVKDYEKLPGLFTLYRKKEGDRETIYLEIKEDQLDTLMMLEATASTGTGSMFTVVAGDPLNDIVFKFSKNGNNQILMVTPNIAFRAAEKTPLARAVRRSFADGYLEAFKIEAKQPERKSLLINISDLFKSDIAQIGMRLGGGGGIFSMMGRGGGYSVDREKTYLAQLKNFPDNMVVETAYHFTGGGGRMGGFSLGAETLADPRSIPLNVYFNLFPLPENGYRPRLADPRVGYFTTDVMDFSDDSQDEPIVRYVLRWPMEKADPKAALSPPKKPIVFWLDNAIPLEYRDAVRDGILFWNKAFEKVGIKDAIVVKQMPDNADWDHADMRYNTIRWVTSPEGGYAVALFRANPLTGQILNANITVDANLPRAIKLERKHVVDPASYFQEAEADPKKIDPRRCDMAAEAMEQAWFGDMALKFLTPAEAKLDEKAYIQAFLRYVVSHEMGHVLGLRHNFIASTCLSMEDLQDEKRIAEEGTSASVMDYVAFNPGAIKHPGVDYWSPTIGPYDIWAIQYGYTPVEARTPEGELYQLHVIASRSSLPGHAYETDENADMFDPAVARWDIGREPLAYWTRSLQVSRFLLFHLGERVPKQGESYWEFTRDFNRLLGMYARSAAVASRYIGGQHISRNHRGDPGEKPVLSSIPAAQQKQALELLTTYIFSENAFAFLPSYYGKLTTHPFDGYELAGFPIRDTLAGIQRAALQRLFSPLVLSRIVNNEFKAGETSKALTLPTLYRMVGGAVWSELDTRKDISSLRRQLQRVYLDTLIDMVVNPGSPAPEDARMLAWDQLRQLRTKLASAKQAPHDEYTRVHLEEALMQVNRALEARQVIGGASSSQGMSLLQMLLGGAKQQPADK